MDGIDIRKVVYDEKAIKQKVEELGNLITKDFKGKDTVVIGVLKGSMYFFTDLTRAIDLPIETDMIAFGNDPDNNSGTGIVKIFNDVTVDIRGKHVILIEDVIRTGLTTAYLISNLEKHEPADITVCTMLFNPERLLLPMPIGYIGFNIKDEWLVGYGLDVNEIGRNIPYIAELKNKPQKQ